MLCLYGIASRQALIGNFRLSLTATDQFAPAASTTAYDDLVVSTDSYADPPMLLDLSWRDHSGACLYFLIYAWHEFIVSIYLNDNVCGNFILILKDSKLMPRLIPYRTFLSHPIFLQDAQVNVIAAVNGRRRRGLRRRLPLSFVPS